MWREYARDREGKWGTEVEASPNQATENYLRITNPHIAGKLLSVKGRSKPYLMASIGMRLSCGRPLPMGLL